VEAQTPGETPGSAEHGEAAIRLETDRFSRLRAIPGWTEANVRAARVLCVGGGALGNEIVKNLALVGVGSIYIVDPDRIETSNLTRSPLFRPSDIGRPKAEAAAMAAKSIWQGARVFYCIGRVGADVGYGVFRRMSVVLGGVDNRLARRDVGRACYRFSRPYVDAGLDRLDGAVHHFLSPDEACYECTLGTTELDDLEAQYSCLGLAQPGVVSPEVAFAPTSPITSAIVAGLQCQAALKIIDGWPSTALPPSGSALRYSGVSGTLRETNAFARPSCDTHLSGRIDPTDIIELDDRSASGTTLAQIVATGRGLTSDDAYVDFARGRFDVYRDLVVTATCQDESFCRESGAAEPLFQLRSKLTTHEQDCPGCGQPRFLDVVHEFRGNEWYASRSLADLGIPPLHLIPIYDPRSSRTLYLELTGDAARLFDAGAVGGAPTSGGMQPAGLAGQHDGETGPITWRSIPVQTAGPMSWREVVE
jgi:adenylyltransferase/sulfurtransferase